MAGNEQAWRRLIEELTNKVTLVAVSKIRTPEDIMDLYRLGQRDFGENYVQELLDKADRLPKDIRWHFIGHLQSNKVKQIVPVAHLIQGVDSLKLLTEINKQSAKLNRVTNVLLQVHIATEETKFGLDEAELREIVSRAQEFSSVRLRGLMGMASNTDNEQQVRSEFARLRQLFEDLGTDTHFNTLSMGMSADFPLAVSEGSNMVRIGSLLFGTRPQHVKKT